MKVKLCNSLFEVANIREQTDTTGQAKLSERPKRRISVKLTIWLAHLCQFVPGTKSHNWVASRVKNSTVLVSWATVLIIYSYKVVSTLNYSSVNFQIAINIGDMNLLNLRCETDKSLHACDKYQRCKRIKSWSINQFRLIYWTMLWKIANFWKLM